MPDLTRGQTVATLSQLPLNCTEEARNQERSRAP
jgi:hypothetical protein